MLLDESPDGHKDSLTAITKAVSNSPQDAAATADHLTEWARPTGTFGGFGRV